MMQVEIDDMYNKCKEYEDATKDANSASDKNDIDIRDVGKKVQKMETKMEEILEQLQASNSKMEQLDAEYKDKEEDVNAQSRRVLLLESECSIQIEKLASTVLKLALMSKDADNIVKGCRHWESKVGQAGRQAVTMCLDHEQRGGDRGAGQEYEGGQENRYTIFGKLNNKHFSWKIIF